MRSLKIRIIVAVGALIVSSAMFCAAQSANADEARKVFPDASAVFLERSVVLNLTIERDSVRAFTDVYEDMLHLKSQTEMYASRKVYGSHFQQIENLKAKTLVWDKNKYREMLVSNFKKNAEPGDHVFFDDSYFYSFNYPSVAAGNRTQLEYREVHKDVRFLSGFVFGSYLPQMRTSYTIRTPKDVDISYKIVNDPENKIKFKKSEKGNAIIYEWVVDRMQPIHFDEGSPSFRYFEPHVICYAKSYTTKKGTVNILPDLKSLYQWYYAMVANLHEEPSAELDAVVQSIKKDALSEQEVVKGIFYWVQSNIQYIAFEEGMRGFIPHIASYTFDKRYGDCKDMANLIVNMLRLAGIKGYHTWIGTRDLPYRYSDFPTPIVDNHMIATYISSDGNYYFLDATGKYTPFGYPTSMIQGKEALIALAPESFMVKQVPEIAKDRNLITDSVFVRIANNVVTGKGNCSLNGLYKAGTAYYLERIEEKQIRDYVKHFVEKGNNKFTLDQYEVKYNGALDKPTLISYRFTIGDYHQSLGDELYINLNLTKDNYNRFINLDVRKTPHEFDFKYHKTEFVEFEIPEGYEVDYLPPDDTYDGKLLGYQLKYKQHGNKIRLNKFYYIDYLLMKPEEFKLWNEEVGKISNAYKETIILKKKI
jgi:hypothetical protein